jgi:hypothetical protein
MTVTAIYSVFCDVDGPACVGWTGEHQHQPEVRNTARRDARREGWVRKRVGSRIIDICPYCLQSVDIRIAEK